MVFLGIGVAALTACEHQRTAPRTPIEAGTLRGANVLLVTIDTLRADFVGAYGSTRGLTPTLDEFAKGGVLFRRTYAHVPLTLPSHASLLSASYPTRNGVHDNGDVPSRRVDADAGRGTRGCRLPNRGVRRRVRARRAVRSQPRFRSLRRPHAWPWRRRGNRPPERRTGARTGDGNGSGRQSSVVSRQSSVVSRQSSVVSRQSSVVSRESSVVSRESGSSPQPQECPLVCLGQFLRSPRNPTRSP